MTPVNETRKKIIYIAQAGVVAALYTVLTIIAAGFDLALKNRHHGSVRSQDVSETDCHEFCLFPGN